MLRTPGVNGHIHDDRDANDIIDSHDKIRSRKQQDSTPLTNISSRLLNEAQVQMPSAAGVPLSQTNLLDAHFFSPEPSTF